MRDPVCTKLMLNAFLLVGALAITAASQAQFLDEFDRGSVEGWEFFTGDGAASVDLVPMDGYARIQVDATDDRHNVWWAIIKRDIADHLNMEKLKDPANELHVEARVRVSHAPRRINFMINTQRTTDFHRQLREYDIPNTTEWYTISMTTDDLDAVPGDALNVQMGVTDWGVGRYHVDVDYYRADIVRAADAPPEKGEPLIYHPPVPPRESFTHQLVVAQDALINADFPGVNFHDWSVAQGEESVRVLTVSANQWPILRWDFEGYEGRRAEGAAVLELTTQSVHAGGDYVSAYGEDLGVEFDKIRVFEIFGGAADWDQRTVTYESLTGNRALTELINGQMIFDVEPARAAGGTTFVTISRPVMQRLLDGTTRGLMIRPLGALEASFYDSESDHPERAPVLHFSTREDESVSRSN